MLELGVVLTWIAISAASAKGLSVFARVAATNEVEAELVEVLEDEPGYDEPYDRYPVGTPSHPLVCS